jgi:hypothetical protein
MMETIMFRKLRLVAIAAALFGCAALAPTPAAAWYGRYHHGWWGLPFHIGAPVSYGYGNCYVRQLLPTPWGPLEADQPLLLSRFVPRGNGLPGLLQLEHEPEIFMQIYRKAMQPERGGKQLRYRRV